MKLKIRRTMTLIDGREIDEAGTPADVPMNHKHANYVRSHYDGMSLTFDDAPAPDEMVLIF